MLDGLENASTEMEEAKVCNLYGDLYFLPSIYRHFNVLKMDCGW